MAISQRTPGDGSGPESSCAPCHDHAHQARRHLHFLDFYDETKLARHLRGQYGPSADLDGTIAAIQGWCRQIRAQYSDLVDDEGNWLTVGAAWQQALRAQHQRTSWPRWD